MIEPFVLFVPVLLVAGLVAALAVEHHRHRPREPAGWLEEAVRRRLLVHTRDGATFDGQLARVDVDGLVLSPATMEGEYDLGGEVWVPRERIGWLQQPAAENEGGTG